jgi:hypothetical protein
MLDGLRSANRVAIRYRSADKKAVDERVRGSMGPLMKSNVFPSDEGDGDQPSGNTIGPRTPRR